MELEVPPCSDSELALLHDRWTHRALTREPLAVAMARAFSREIARRCGRARSDPEGSPPPGAC